MTRDDDDTVKQLKGLLRHEDQVSVDDILLRAHRIRRRRWVSRTAALAMALALVGAVMAFKSRTPGVTVNTASGLSGSSPSPQVSAASSPSPELTVPVAPTGTGVTLQVPSTWRVDPTYPTARYQGTDGFVQVAQFGFSDPNQVCQGEVTHVGNPYGSNPTVVTMTVAGQPACMILPSADAPAEIEGRFQSALFVVAYPQPVSTWGSVGISADPNHIRSLVAGMTVTATNSSSG